MDAVDELALGFVLIGAADVPLDMGQLNERLRSGPSNTTQLQAMARGASRSKVAGPRHAARRRLSYRQAPYRRVGRRSVDSRGCAAPRRLKNLLVVLGEPGTDRLGLAQTIHAASTRRSGPFVPLNCRALDANVVARELFGTADDDDDVSPVKAAGCSQPPEVRHFLTVSTRCRRSSSIHCGCGAR